MIRFYCTQDDGGRKSCNLYKRENYSRSYIAGSMYGQPTITQVSTGNYVVLNEGDSNGNGWPTVELAG